ncbi:TetR/AcrR family transcriptional regulator [Fusibacter paucivorans]|uniref:TetR/AcrR family transcriptional regulator n=1 Tax=Fusibacter paucivorans TaxID=76009 RepID=A0ABS5PRB6_9FIRM|nr:TetR/AcrR family transcriptional regulator [Fusibacter paucivorans]MBS7527699.1 TetR/AcrR family transcriptional regulator [Fusibacter paucivorans]
MKKREITTQQILESAVDVIAEKGYNAAKTQEIAERAGVSEATVFKYFKSKKGILDGIAVHAVKLFGRAVALTPIKELLETKRDVPVDQVIDFVIEDRLKFIQKQYPLIAVMVNEAQYHQAFRDTIVAEIFNPMCEAFEAYYQYQASLGNVREVESPRILFRTIVVNMMAPIFQRVIMEQPIEMDALRGEYETIKDILKHGVIK